MVTRDFSGEEVYKALVNTGNFRHVRTTGNQLILRWDPPEDHNETDARVVAVPAHNSLSIGTLRDIADDPVRTTSRHFASGLTAIRRSSGQGFGMRINCCTIQ
jgi:predicted RNA binding protein YcfA (HicA-like mRNA interferase family)